MHRYKYFSERRIPTYIVDDLQRSSLDRFNEFVQRELSRPLMQYVEQKLHIALIDRGMSDPRQYHNGEVTYRGEIYIMSRDEVEVEVRDRVDKEVQRKLDLYNRSTNYGRFGPG